MSLTSTRKIGLLFQACHLTSLGKKLKTETIWQLSF